jgi:branched-chain amino acid transport system permease protein
MFFGIGAYVSALVLSAGLPWWMALFLAGLTGSLAAVIVSPLLIPQKGGAFSLASLVLLLLLHSLFKNFPRLTGGVDGLSISLMEAGLWLSCTVFLFIFCLYIHHTLSDSTFIRELRAIADDSQAAALCGLSCQKIRTKALVLGSVMAALSGGILPMQSSYISLQSAFGLEVAFAPVIIVLIGGPGTRYGPLLGTLLYIGLQEMIWTGLGAWHLALLGTVLVLSGVFFPKGLAGLFR